MDSTEYLSGYEDNWQTEMGAWFPGQRVILRDKDLFAEFADKKWMQLLVYAITGRSIDVRQASLLESIWNIATSFPDPRLWNNRVAALSGTGRSTCGLAIASAIAASEASIFGGQPILKTTQLLIDLNRESVEDLDAKLEAYLKRYRAIPGFGRPIEKVDERIKPVLAVAARLGLDTGSHLALVRTIESSEFARRFKITANIAAIYGALMADMCFTAQQAYQLSILAFSAGMFPCFLDARDKPQGAFFPLRTTRLSYQGRKSRKWRSNDAFSK